MRKILVVFVLACCMAPALAADVSDLVKKLKSKDNETRRSAAKDLSELGKDASPALTALTRALKDKDRFVRRFAAQALGNIGPAAKSAIPDLARLLDDDAQPVRESAIKALADMGSPAVPTLSKVLSAKDAASDVQERAIAALAKVGAEGLPAIIRVIKDVKIDAGLRRRGIEAVVSMGKAGKPGVDAVASVVKNPKAVGANAGQLRDDAIEALGSIATKEDSSAVTALDELVKDETNTNMGQKNRARQALKKINAR